MKISNFFWVILTLSACSVKINSRSNENNDFRSNKAVVKYKDASAGFENNQFVEITSSDIVTVASKNKLTIFYMLAPWCSPCVKKFTDYYVRLDSFSKNYGIPLFVFNNSYGFERTIEKIYKRVNFQSPIYVLDNSAYSKDIEVNTSDFLRVICKDCVSNSNGFILLLDKNAEVKYFINDLTDVALILEQLNKKL